MKNREEIEALVQQLLAAPEREAVRLLIQQNVDEVGALFYEILEAHASADFAVEVAQIHMAARSEADARLLALIPALLDWETDKELRELIARYGNQIDEAAVVGLLDLAESCIAYRDDPKLAERALRTADLLIEESRLTHLEPIASLHTGNLHLRRGDAGPAEAALADALEATANDKASLVWTAAAISKGHLLTHQGRAEDAIAWYQQIIPCLSDQHQRHAAEQNLAIAEFGLGRVTDALARLLKLETDCTDTGDERILANVHGNLALLYERLGQDALQERHLLAGHRLQARPTDPTRQIDWGQLLVSCINLHIFYMNTGRVDDASAWLNTAEDLFKKTDTDSGEITRSRLRIGFLLATDRIQEAWQLARPILFDAKRIAENGGDEVLLLIGNAGRAAIAAKEYGLAQEAFALLVRLCEAKDALDLLVSSLGYETVALVRLGDRQSAALKLARMLREERSLREMIHGALFQFGFSGSLETLYDNLIAALQAAADADLLFEAVQSCKAFAIGRAAPRLATCHDVSGAIAPRSALLEFDHHGNKGRCLLVRPGDRRPELIDLDVDYDAVVAAAVEFENRMRWARLVLSDSPFECLNDVASSILRPVLDRLSKETEHLVIAPAGASARLPFHLFPMRNGERLIDRYSTTYAPSATVWSAARTRSRRPNSALVLANGMYADAANIKENFAHEAGEVGAIVTAAGISLQMEAGTVNTAPALLANLDRDILHLAAHGRFDAATPEATGVVLTEHGHDRLLSLDFLARHTVNAELAFLSGCETGRVSALRNQEVLGLMSILLSTNVTSAVLSFWPVPATSDAIISLVSSFYRLWLMDSRSKTDALRASMLEHRDKPLYIWGGFGIFGFADN